MTCSSNAHYESRLQSRALGAATRVVRHRKSEAICDHLSLNTARFRSDYEQSEREREFMSEQSSFRESDSSNARQLGTQWPENSPLLIKAAAVLISSMREAAELLGIATYARAMQGLSWTGTRVMAYKFCGSLPRKSELLGFCE